MMRHSCALALLLTLSSAFSSEGFRLRRTGGHNIAADSHPDIEEPSQVQEEAVKQVDREVQDTDGLISSSGEDTAGEEELEEQDGDGSISSVEEEDADGIEVIEKSVAWKKCAGTVQKGKDLLLPPGGQTTLLRLSTYTLARAMLQNVAGVPVEVTLNDCANKTLQAEESWEFGRIRLDYRDGFDIRFSDRNCSGIEECDSFELRAERKGEAEGRPLRETWEIELHDNWGELITLRYTQQ